MAKVLIVEDELSTAELLKELIEATEKYQVVEMVESIDSAVEFLEKNQNELDVIFLDIHLADGESFLIFQEIEILVPVIFCTAFDEYLLKAFKHNGIEYILKPFKQSDIDQALSKFENLKRNFSGSEKQDSEPISKKAILVHYREKTFPIAVEQIGIVHISEGITYVHNRKGDSFHISKTMDEMELDLSKHLFYRVNRQLILNREIVVDVEPFINRKVIVRVSLDFSKQIIVSRLKVSPFLKWLENG